jgi:glycosyltransferase involved in cell wall biosynthesis
MRPVTLSPLVDEICTAFKGRRFEIIYIDDASTDGTAAELSDLLKICAAIAGIAA